MVAGIKQLYDYGMKFQTFKDTDFKQKGVEAVIAIALLSALKKGVEGNAFEALLHMGNASLFYAGKSLLHVKALGEITVSLSTELGNLRGQLQIVNKQISDLEKLKTKSGELIGDQLKLLQTLQSESDKLETRIKTQEDLLKTTKDQQQKLDLSIDKTTSQIQQKRLTMLTFLDSGNKKLESLSPDMSAEERTKLVGHIGTIAEMAKNLLEKSS